MHYWEQGITSHWFLDMFLSDTFFLLFHHKLLNLDGTLHLVILESGNAILHVIIAGYSSLVEMVFCSLSITLSLCDGILQSSCDTLLSICDTTTFVRLGGNTIMLFMPPLAGDCRRSINWAGGIVSCSNVIMFVAQ